MKKNSNIILPFLLIVFLITSFKSYSQEGYQITIKVEGSTDSSLLMTCYYGKKIKLVDTAYLVAKNTYVFDGRKKLPGGIYMAVTPGKSKLFEFIIGENQHFTLQTDTLDYARNMKVNNSDENIVFYDYLKYNEEIYQQNKSLSTKIKELETDSDDSQTLRKQLDSLNKVSIDYKLGLIDQNPELFVSTLFSAMRDVEVPDSVLNNPDSTLAFKYYKAHYWDYFKMNDSCLLRTPMISNKLDQYFERAVFFHPDSVISAIDEVVQMARPSNEMVSYLIWHFMSEYQNPKFMGFDKVFVHLADNYFAKEAIENSSPSVLKMINERADILRPILLGEPAPNMILIDTTGQLKSMYSVKNDYVLILFWDENCGICKQEIEDLKTIYQQNSYNLEIFAVCVNSDLEKWKKVVVERNMPWINVNGTRSATPDFHDLYDIHGTPVIYLLDKDKKIIAKRINAEQVPELLENLKNAEK